MTHSDGCPNRAIATLNTDAIGFGSGRRRIDCLKQLAYDCNLTNEQARLFGDLRATATWEKLLLAHGLEFEPRTENTYNTVEPVNTEAPHQINLMDWVDWAQAFALALASVGLAVLILGLFPRLNSLHFLPSVKITIQVGK